MAVGTTTLPVGEGGGDWKGVLPQAKRGGTMEGN